MRGSKVADDGYCFIAMLGAVAVGMGSQDLKRMGNLFGDLGGPTDGPQFNS